MDFRSGAQGTAPASTGPTGGFGRGLRADSASSDDSGFGDDSLPPDEYIQLRLQKMGSLMDASDPSHAMIDEMEVTTQGGDAAAASPLLALAQQQRVEDDQKKKSAMTVYEKLQALSLDEALPSALHLVDNASSLPAPDSARYFGAGGDGGVFMGTTPNSGSVAFATGNRAFMTDDDDVDDDDEDDAYVITWEGGQLGLIFKANPAGQVVIRRVNKKGTALGLHYARAGDVLIGLNGISVQGVPFLDIVEQLKNPRFPIKLEFEPMKFAALPPSAVQPGGVSTYAYSTPTSSSSKDLPSPASSAGTVEVTDQESSYVYVPRNVDETRDDRSSRSAHYDVVWDEGPLGCGLKHRSGHPTVKSVNRVGVSASVAQIGAGDILIVINGYKTKEIGFKSAIAMLQRAPKPIYLRFKRQSPIQSSAATGSATAAAQPAANNVNARDKYRDSRIGQGDDGSAAGVQLAPLQYSVLWRDGPLGIQIKSGTNGLVFVSRLTGAGNPTMTAQITPGDLFVRIAGVDVASRGIAGAFELLKNVQKPVMLVFQKPSKDDALGPVPSFRKLREEAAAAAAAANANAGAGASTQTGSVPHLITRTQSTGTCETRHKVDEEDSWQTRTAPYPHYSSIDTTIRMRPAIKASKSYDFDEVSESGSQQSNSRTDYSVESQQSQNPERASYALAPPSSHIAGSYTSIEENLPRFSDIEAGRVVTTEVTALPPPPSYLDVFTQSGRSRDMRDLTRQRPGSPPSESVSVSSEQHSDRHAAPLPPPPAMNDLGAFSSLPPPPPPQYSSSFFPADAAPQSRLQELRQQYIETERRRNQTQFSGTMMSSYSDLDDSGVMRQRNPSGAAGAGGGLFARASSSPLPLPELWVRWSDGPLGITFKRKNGQIVVSRLTGAGSSPGLEQLRTGDWLVSFNNHSTRDLRLSETMELLKRLPKPINMCFVVQ